MGEVAEMMIDGTLCQRCGTFLDGESPGFPRLCEDCQSDDLDGELTNIPYDYNFSKVAIEKLVAEIIEEGTIKQRKAIIKVLYKCIDKVKKTK